MIMVEEAAQKSRIYHYNNETSNVVYRKADDGRVLHTLVNLRFMNVEPKQWVWMEQTRYWLYWVVFWKQYVGNINSTHIQKNTLRVFTCTLLVGQSPIVSILYGRVQMQIIMCWNALSSSKSKLLWSYAHTLK